MTSRLTLMIATLGLLALAGCAGSAAERGVPGPAVGKGVGSVGGSSDTAGKKPEAVDEAESASGGLIETELGYPVQDERLGKHAGY